LSVASSATHRTIDVVWRMEAPRVVAGLTRMVRDVGLAEDLAQDALVVALERWPQTGVPDNPGAWLTATAKHRAIDLLRRDKRLAGKREQLEREVAVQSAMAASDFDAVDDDAVEDDLLRLMFTCCHPLLGTQARIALTLRLLGGLTTEEIARAFLVPAATVAQRIVRAKRTLSGAHVPFEVPGKGEARRSSSSTARWPSRWRSDRRPAWSSWTRWTPSPR
jgi:RNA polymerase sigma factor (sigma-70 family)